MILEDKAKVATFQAYAEHCDGSLGHTRVFVMHILKCMLLFVCWWRLHADGCRGAGHKRVLDEEAALLFITLRSGCGATAVIKRIAPMLPLTKDTLVALCSLPLSARCQSSTSSSEEGDRSITALHFSSHKRGSLFGRGLQT